jgi:response regulator RpfG family c-di-GMP phosphodiesterase
MGHAIPLIACIMSVVDVVDPFMLKLVNKEAKLHEQVL